MMAVLWADGTGALDLVDLPVRCPTLAKAVAASLAVLPRHAGTAGLPAMEPSGASLVLRATWVRLHLGLEKTRLAGRLGRFG
jgi:hypothetical protein